MTVELIKPAQDAIAAHSAGRATARGYAAGEFFSPVSPPGLEGSYEDLAKIVGIPLLQVAVGTVVDRLALAAVRVDGADDEATTSALDRCRWASRQTSIYEDGLVEGFGLVSVWPDEETREPAITFESPANIHLGWNALDPFKLDHAVKVVAGKTTDDPTRVWVYTPETVDEYEGADGDWKLVSSASNPMGRVPFAAFTPRRTSRGLLRYYVDPLIPIVQAIDTIRYDLMLAAQFAAYRQRIATGVDPVVRDAEGNPVFKTKLDSTGAPLLDDSGNQVLELDDNGFPIPVLQRPGAPGVDRLLVFPGESTKVYDLAESDLKNYIQTAEYLAASFSAASRVPSQYLAIGDWSNVSGDTMEANEAGLRSLVHSLQRAGSDFIRDIAELVALATGRTPGVVEVSWMNLEPKSLTQVASAASQMVPVGAPLEFFLEMLTSSPAELDRLLSLAATAAPQSPAQLGASVSTAPL